MCCAVVASHIAIAFINGLVNNAAELAKLCELSAAVQLLFGAGIHLEVHYPNSNQRADSNFDSTWGNVMRDALFLAKILDNQKNCCIFAESFYHTA